MGEHAALAPWFCLKCDSIELPCQDEVGQECPLWVEICREDATGKPQLSAVTALNRPFRSRPNQAGLEGSFRPSARRAIS